MGVGCVGRRTFEVAKSKTEVDSVLCVGPTEELVCVKPLTFYRPAMG